MSHQLLSSHMDHTYAAKERSLKNPALYSDMDWEDDEFAKYKLPINKNNLYPIEALYSDMDWSEDEFADCKLLIGADKLYTVENTTSTSSVFRRLLTAPTKDKKGVVSLILVNNRRLWIRKDLNCHVKKGSSVQGRISQYLLRALMTGSMN